MSLINLPNGKTFAWAPRSGSTAILRAIVVTFFAERLNQRIVTPKGLPPDPHAVAPSHSEVDAGNEVVILLRDPVERFRSACSKTGKSVTEGLSSLGSDPHFAPYNRWFRILPPGVKVFCFETEFNACTEYLGLGALAQENVGENKPTLTADELAAVQAAYAEEVAWTAALTAPATLQTPPARELSKLTLKRKLEALGKWDTFKAALAANPSLDDEFWLAQTISTGDAMFTSYAPALKAALGLADAQFDSLLEP